MALNRPGVDVQISSLQAVPPLSPAPSTFFLVGYAPWGPVNKAVYVGDIRTAHLAFGEPSTPETGMWIPRILEHFLKTSQGYGRAWVVRGFEVGAGKTLDDYRATITLNDGAVTPVDVLQVQAAWPGELGLTFKVDVIDDPNGTRKIYMWGRYGVEVFTWQGTQTDIQAAIDEWNARADNMQSDFRLTLVNYVAAGPATTTSDTVLLKPSAGAVSLTRPASTANLDGDTGTFPLSALFGTDANGAPQGLDVLADRSYGPGIVAIPGYTPDATLVNTLDLHAQQYSRVAIVSLLPSGATPLDAAGAKTLKDSLPASSYVAYYFPRVKDADGVLSPVEGFVAGLAAAQMARTDADGGIKASITGVLPVSGVEQVNNRDPVGDPEAELLYLDQVNFIRFVRGQGYRLEAQLLSKADGAISRFHHRNITNYFDYMLTDLLQGFRDRTIDSTGALQEEIKQSIEMSLSPYGPGKTPPKGNTLWNPAVVITDNSIQNAADLNQGLLHVYVEAALSPKAERIQLLFNVVPVTIS